MADRPRHDRRARDRHERILNLRERIRTFSSTGTQYTRGWRPQNKTARGMQGRDPSPPIDGLGAQLVLADDRAVQTRRADTADLDAIAALSAHAFNQEIDPTSWKESGRVLVDDRGNIRAAVRALGCHQYYGGRAVTSAMIADMMVDHTQRGRGCGRQLMLGTLDELSSRSIPLAGAYATTAPWNRSVGMEIAGLRVTRECWLQSLSQALARHAPAEPREAEAWDLMDDAGVMRCYDQIARYSNGHVKRSSDWWRRHILAPARDAGFTGQLVRNGSETVGYAIYRLLPGRRKKTGVPIQDIDCLEIVAATSDAFVANLALVQRYGSPMSRLRWRGSARDPMYLYLGQHEMRNRGEAMFFMSVLNVEQALAQRGHPRSLRAQCDMVVAQASARSRNLRITVADGVAEVARIEVPRRDAARLDITTLAAMYAGWLAPRDAVRLGRLSASEEVVDDLALILPLGPSWTPELI
jgi:predicted acetyltransferase